MGKSRGLNLLHEEALSAAQGQAKAIPMPYAPDYRGWLAIYDTEACAVVGAAKLVDIRPTADGPGWLRILDQAKPCEPLYCAPPGSGLSLWRVPELIGDYLNEAMKAQKQSGGSLPSNPTAQRNTECEAIITPLVGVSKSRGGAC